MNGIMMRAATLGGIDLVPPFLPRDSLDGGCERLHHRALAPMQHRCLDGRPAEVPVTKMSVRRLHVVDGPLRCLDGGCERLRVLIRHHGQRVDGLSRALNVDWVKPVVKVLWTAIVLKKVGLEEGETAYERFVETRVQRRSTKRFER